MDRVASPEASVTVAGWRVGNPRSVADWTRFGGLARKRWGFLVAEVGTGWKSEWVAFGIAGLISRDLTKLLVFSSR